MKMKKLILTMMLGGIVLALSSNDLSAQAQRVKSDVTLPAKERKAASKNDMKGTIIPTTEQKKAITENELSHEQKITNANEKLAAFYKQGASTSEITGLKQALEQLNSEKMKSEEKAIERLSEEDAKLSTIDILKYQVFRTDGISKIRCSNRDNVLMSLLNSGKLNEEEVRLVNQILNNK